MSADNWTKCPRCVQNHTAAVAKHASDVEAAYGKVPASEYEALKAKVPAEPGATLAEFCEIGMWLGHFEASYSAICTVCGFEYKFNYEDKDVLKEANRG